MTLAPDMVSTLEDRAQVDSLGDLHQRRRTLLVSLAPLKALHGHNGIWDDKRKHMLEAMKMKARAALSATGQKATEGMVDAMAYGDEHYERFLDEGILARIDFIRQANELSEIEERIRSREIELLCYNSEAKLAR